MQTSPQETVTDAPSAGRSDAEAVALWVASRAGIVLAVTVGAGILPGDQERTPFLERWQHWDATHLVEIAKFGYDGDPAQGPDAGLPAFFPGMPLALRLVDMIVHDWSLAGLLISLVAGAVAMVSLARLGEFEGPAGTGTRAVLALLLCPTAVFLFAGYSEALFLAFAIPAWLCARRGNWMAAGLLAAGASCVRVTGLFLALALIVEFVVRRGGTRSAAWLLVPFIPLVLYSAYQYSRTGDWLAWQHAQEAGWGRQMVWPWESFLTTWRMAADDGQFTWAFRLEVAGALLGVAAAVWLLVARRWAEFVYVGLQLGALLLSAYYLSIPRSALLWWPLWIMLGQLAVRHRAVLIGYALLAGPLMVLNTVTFISGAWAG
ncbi:mannosyltransferase family protein [Sphaerisporangium sp. TRM90804]|uniref:mannosyltransferase family protein n=1 Tax=Sphaerisporangium sp. TRM90804 TaxID=3031113 RepID=UPI00244704D8|nr:mannosyltransferase family protein [Sphaerisporangium sp. TRM90804]MDH2425536.1 mannosyltransferase family protein [Sphaerisporangium sp. TRM90804]